MKINKIKFVFLLFFTVSLLASISYAEELNLARDCMVSCNKGDNPEFVVDGNRTGKYWEARWKPSPCWVEVDLGEIREINKIHLYMWWGGDNRYYQYYINVSCDRKRWKEIVDERENTVPSSAEGRIYTFTPIKARFVRLTVTYNSANIAAHVREMEIYGNTILSSQSPLQNTSVEREKVQSK